MSFSIHDFTSSIAWIGLLTHVSSGLGTRTTTSTSFSGRICVACASAPAPNESVPGMRAPTFASSAF